MNVWIIVGDGVSLVQVVTVMVMFTSSRKWRPSIPRVGACLGIVANTLYMTGSVLAHLWVVLPFHVIVTVFYLWMIFKFDPPRRRKIRKVAGEKARAARAKLVASVPVVHRPSPAS